ncbi:hypothetical protein A1O3_09556 [Capronia epimyces CBS 606.96]|uniref:Zn(2)-C6 fungal-type domain-containing protein n=1 Tax=Capronia epimyces CBS 606.96 TaxID=1182542 RepID=W9XJ19_9EURO|nr:uncharacterized protein A1O3_09556 [Capronia epimyces CBS 606.96]EXJ77330.1 hypothetical protein A1O3_09556 [Capronia epimyces CBS 606.96]
MPKSPPTAEGSYIRFRLAPAAHKGGLEASAKRPRLDSGEQGGEQAGEQGGRAGLACYRCRQRKKKCCRSLPECSACVARGVRCVFPSKSDSISTSEAMELKSQIEWLSQHVSVVDGSQMLSPTATATSAASTTMAEGPNPESDDAGAALQSHVDRHQPKTKLRLPAWAERRHLVEAYFRHVHKAYPFLDRQQVLEDLDRSTRGLPSDTNEVSPLVYVLCAIGSATLHRIGKLSDEALATMTVPYKYFVNSCLAEPNVESTGILMLVTIYSVFDPDGISPWLLTGLLGRQAIALGLSRRSSTEHGLTLQEVETRHRLFWSIYALDREIAASFGLPVAINDENVNVPLPSVTIDEYASPSRVRHSRILQVCRNAIALRELEGKILQQVHLSNPISSINVGNADRQGVIDRFKSNLDDWYANGCLLSQLEDDEISFHDTIPWLNVRYHGLLILLHCPSRFNTYYSRDQLSHLYQSIQKYLQCSAVLLRQGHLMLHHSTLNRILVICLLLIFCLQQGHLDRVREHDLNGDVTLGIEILEAFSNRWPLAKRSLGVFRALHNLLVTTPTDGPHTASILANQETLRGIQIDALAIVQDAMGPSSLFHNLGEESIASGFQAQASGRAGKVRIPFERLPDNPVLREV